MELFAGTSGFSYAEWKGHFYPAGMADDELLAYYAARLPTVEINNTFYRMPRAEILARWAERVPVGFRFILKASQRITHKSRLDDTADSVAYLWKTAGSLGAHLGPFLFQLPPYLRANPDKLLRFLGELPAGMRAAFEFQHASWFQPAVLDALREAGCALCIADHDPPADGSPAPPDPDIVATADFGYLRLRRETYSDAELDAWASRIRAASAAWGHVYVFFKHEDAGAAPAFALRLADRFPPPAAISAHPIAQAIS
jgi:uncharacterized protein YecE (DUF72 family)